MEYYSTATAKAANLCRYAGSRLGNIADNHLCLLEIPHHYTQNNARNVKRFEVLKNDAKISSIMLSE